MDRQEPVVALAPDVSGEFAYDGVRQDNRFVPRRRDALDHVGSRMVEDGLRIGSNCQQRAAKTAMLANLVRTVVSRRRSLNSMAV